MDSIGTRHQIRRQSSFDYLLCAWVRTGVRQVFAARYLDHGEKTDLEKPVFRTASAMIFPMISYPSSTLALVSLSRHGAFLEKLSRPCANSHTRTACSFSACRTKRVASSYTRKVKEKQDNHIDLKIKKGCNYRYPTGANPVSTTKKKCAITGNAHGDRHLSQIETLASMDQFYIGAFSGA